MRTLLLFLMASLCLLLAVPAMGCTAFFLKSGKQMVLAKNLDWPVDLGYVIYNPAGKKKQAFITDGPNRPLQWTAQYPSLTFNQFGVEFPLGGMNSQGLVVEELNMPQVSIQKNTISLQINEFQIVQFLLDHCASVNEVVKELNRLYYTPLLLHLHYFVADQTGKTAILEFDGSQWQIYTPGKPAHAVLSNNPYRESLRYLENFEGFGGKMPVIHRSGSNERFVSTAHMIQQYKGDDLRGYAFSILDTVKQIDTRWSLIYDIPGRRVHFRFHRCGMEKIFSLKAQNADSPAGCNLADCYCLDEMDFKTLQKATNDSLLRQVGKELESHIERDDILERIQQMARYGSQYLRDPNP
jgi:choloylglycine hydrolase